MPIESTLIAVLMGGPGSEREVSLASGRAVLAALQAEGLQAVGVDVTSPVFDLPEGTGLAFNTIHGTFGEDGQLQSLLDARGIPYTGANAAASELAFDKVLSKKAFIAAGVPTPLSETLDCRHGTPTPSFSVPFVVKPPREGSSVGVHIVHTPEEAATALADAAKYGSELLVEQFVKGKELTVGILYDQVFPIVHISPRSGFYDMNNKYPWLNNAGGTDYFCPADLDAESTRRVQAAALQAHRALGIDSYSRVDVLLDDAGNPWVLEANTIPGMTASSLLPKAAAAAGIAFGPLCRLIAERTLASHAS